MSKGNYFDPIVTEVMGSLLIAISEEMSAALVRTAYSPNIKERADCSTAIFDSSGAVVAQAQRLPLHMGSLLGTVAEVVKRFPVSSLGEGDMFLANDPYTGGGSHLPDLNVVAPVFYEGKLVAFVANCAHHSDVGGMVAGSESASSTDIYQEGIRIPPLRLSRRGEIDDGIVELVQLNSRAPAERDGDLRAQIAANTVGARGVQEMCDRYGAMAVAGNMEALLSATEKRARHRYAQMVDGVYSHVEYMDPGLGSGGPIAIAVTVKCSGDTLKIDFTGTDPQVPSGRNVPFGATLATVYAVAKTLLDPRIPSNSGFYRAIDVTAPPGTVVNPTSPAPVSARALSASIVADAVVGAISQAVPNGAVAASGPHQLMTMSGVDDRLGEFFVNYETFAGGLGARAHKNGMDAVRTYPSGAANLPVEPLEHAFPVLIERYELLQGSGGKGLFKGGDGIRRDYRIRTTEVHVGLTGERQSVPACGVDGGADGAVAAFVLNPGTDREEKLPGIVADVVLTEGDVLSIQTPGGGGNGQR